jgi:hypothetical protein
LNKKSGKRIRVVKRHEEMVWDGIEEQPVTPLTIKDYFIQEVNNDHLVPKVLVFTRKLSYDDWVKYNKSRNYYLKRRGAFCNYYYYSPNSARGVKNILMDGTSSRSIAEYTLLNIELLVGLNLLLDTDCAELVARRIDRLIEVFAQSQPIPCDPRCKEIGHTAESRPDQ